MKRGIQVQEIDYMYMSSLEAHAHDVGLIFFNLVHLQHFKVTKSLVDVCDFHLDRSSLFKNPLSQVSPKIHDTTADEIITTCNSISLLHTPPPPDLKHLVVP
ncbi:hypothetical protein HanRHA438_Chr03g0102681 [Helianthus annuus]|nr:hypothetical protein HanRHA438_Chr03g0102681 [Helianthus annuus]